MKAQIHLKIKAMKFIIQLSIVILIIVIIAIPSALLHISKETMYFNGFWCGVAFVYVGQWYDKNIKK